MTIETESPVARFLLNRLTEVERCDLESRFIADEAAYAELVAAEEALIDASIHGDLDPEDRRRFESAIEASPALRSRVELAIATRRVIRRTRLAEGSASHVRPPGGVPALRAWLPLAAMLVMAVGSLVWTTLAGRDVVHFSLSSLVTRSVSSVPRVALRPHVREVRFAIDVETESDVVDVVLRNPAGLELERWRAVPLSGPVPLRRATIAVPADLLNGGPHELVLSVPGAPPEGRDLTYCPFVIDRD